MRFARFEAAHREARVVVLLRFVVLRADLVLVDRIVVIVLDRSETGALNAALLLHLFTQLNRLEIIAEQRILIHFN